MSNRTIKINAKCSDMFAACLVEPGKAARNYDGYVPSWFPSPGTEHYGDYVELEIDVDTGRIINWKKPTVAQLNETFKAE